MERCECCGEMKFVEEMYDQYVCKECEIKELDSLCKTEEERIKDLYELDYDPDFIPGDRF